VKAAGLLLGLWLAAAASAADSGGAQHIRAGRAALAAGNPAAARVEFQAAVGSSLADEDRFAAWLGLGRAELWLGQYRSALHSLGQARRFAASGEDRHVAEAATARALNALEYHREAYALVAPFAAGDPAATLELARAAIALGRADEAVRYTSALPAPDASTRTGIDLTRAESRIDFELSSRAEAGYSLVHDSDDLTVRTYGLTALLPGAPGGASFGTWRVSAARSDVSAPGQSEHLTEAGLGDRLRIGALQHLDLEAGVGSAAGRDFFEGSLQWDDRLNDTASVFASADRLPIVTPTALENGLLYSTFSLGASLRPADHAMLVPVYFHQTFSDGNQRDGGRLKIVLTPFEIPDSTSALGADIEARAYRSTQPSAGTYFNPARYHQEQVGLIGVHQFNPDWRMRLTAGIGSESVDGSSGRTWSAALLLTGRLGRNGRLELRVGRDSFASFAGGGSGYWSNGGSLTVSWPFAPGYSRSPRE
jgi:tetratricopeptide (TPR) repeat protein